MSLTVLALQPARAPGPSDMILMTSGVAWILAVLCAAGCPLSSASAVLGSTPVVQAGQNVSLLCNTTSSDELTWYLLRSEQLLPLLTVRKGKLTGRDTDDFHNNNSRISRKGDLQGGRVSLEIEEVEEEDAGLYFCVWKYSADVHVNRGIQLTVDGVDGQSSADQMKKPCLGLGICVLPALLALCFICVAGLYLWSGKAAVCCRCKPGRDASRRVTEEESLHYSSLKHPDKPRPSPRRFTGLVKEDVTYSTVNICKSSKV